MHDKNFIEKIPLDFIVFGSDCDILCIGHGGSVTKPPETTSILAQLQSSMKSGDFLELRLFCSGQNAESERRYKLLRLTGFYEYAYIFLERFLLDGEMRCVGFLGLEITDFIPLMSPDADLYQSTTEKILYELTVMLDKSGKTKPGITCGKACFTPETLLITSLSPILYNEMTAQKLSVRNCDIVRFVDIIKLCVNDCSMFGGVRIETKDIGFNHDHNVYPVYPAALVYLFISVLHIMSYVSRGDKVEVNMFFHDEGVIMEFLCGIDPCLKLSRDASTFSELGRLYPDLVFSASVVEILGNGPGFYPTIRCSSDMLDVRMKITGSREKDSEFRYSDPYQAIAALVSEGLSFLFGQR